jgi:hypothetical protein
MTIRTAFLDQSTEIGIIELRTCIEAIVAASPELVARLDQDYTVYAFDYSEYETPLVGQGMLSRCLAAASSTPNVPAHESKTMVTGRVCKNLLGLFGNGIRETLEVKLRLVPVPTCLQNEYLATMETFNDSTNTIPNDFDAAGWSNFLRTNQVFQQPQSSQPPTPVLDGGHNCKSSWNGPQHMPHASHSHSRPPTPHSTAAPIHQSRPSSRNSMHGRPSISQPSTSYQHDMQYIHNTTEGEEGPARKRARTMKADWRGSSAFGTNPESLRVAASTAASIRNQRPSLSGMSNISDFALGDGSGRPPTPRPHNAAQKRAVLTRTTSLAREMSIDSSDLISQYGSDYMEGPMISPEKSETGSTPRDIRSSPPVMRPNSAAPSSPGLPHMPDFADSGFVSGAVDECMTEMDEEILSPQEPEHNAQQFQPAVHPAPLVKMDDVTLVMPGDPSLLPTKVLLRPTLPRPAVKPLPKDAVPRVAPPAIIRRASKAPAKTPAVSSPMLGPTQSLGSAGNSNTFPPSFANAAPSEADRNSPDPEQAQASGDENVIAKGKGIKRKHAIQEKLVQSISQGKPPPFCGNCGEINTPTWRKTFMQLVDGDPSDRSAQELKIIVGTEAMQFDDEGNTVQYRHFRKNVKPEDAAAGWREVQLCNPCGIWLMKWTTMRPPDKWYKPHGAPKSRPGRKKKNPANDGLGSEPLTEAIDGSIPPPEKPAPRRRNNSKIQRTSSTGSQGMSDTENARQSMGPAEAQLALQRAIQSSPPRVVGSQNSPIELLEEEQGGEVIRRLIFPSPRKPGEQKLLDAPSIVVDPSKSSPTRQRAPSIDVSRIDPELIAASADKENVAPTGINHDHDNLAQLFESLTEGSLSPLRFPRTPKSGRSAQTFLTPSSSARKRLALTPRALGGILSPSRSGHRSIDEVEMTPFTRHLTQLLAEANDGNNGHAHAGLEGLGVEFDFDGGADGIDMGHIFTFSDFSNEGNGTLQGSATGSVSGASFDFTMYEDPVEDKAEGQTTIIEQKLGTVTEVTTTKAAV